MLLHHVCGRKQLLERTLVQRGLPLRACNGESQWVLRCPNCKAVLVNIGGDSPGLTLTRHIRGSLGDQCCKLGSFRLKKR
jgi:hypothetical protein